MDSPDASKREALLRGAMELEKQIARRAGFWRGFWAGMLTFLLLAAGMAGALYTQRHAIVEWTINRYVVGFAEDLMAGFPEAYMTHNQDRVLQALDSFTNAVAAKRVSRQELQEIGRKVLAKIKDKRLSYKEMDDILRALESAAQVSKGK